MTFEFDGVLGLGLASLAVDPEFSASAALKTGFSNFSTVWYSIVSYNIELYSKDGIVWYSIVQFRL